MLIGLKWMPLIYFYGKYKTYKEQPLPLLSHPWQILLDIQSKTLLVLLEAISSLPCICHLWKETKFLHHDLISRSYQPPPDKTAPSAATHLLVFESFHQPCWSSLYILKQHNILLVVRCSELNTALKMQPHQSWVQLIFEAETRSKVFFKRKRIYFEIFYSEKDSNLFFFFF